MIAKMEDIHKMNFAIGFIFQIAWAKQIVNWAYSGKTNIYIYI